MHFFPVLRFLMVQMILFQDSNCFYKKYVFPGFFFSFSLSQTILLLQDGRFHTLLRKRKKKRQEKYLQLPQTGREQTTATAWKQHLYNCTNWESSRHTDGLTAGWETAHLPLTRQEKSREKQSRRTPQGLMTVFFPKILLTHLLFCLSPYIWNWF